MNNKDVTRFQRILLGTLCLLLAPSCILFGLFGHNLPYWYCSISATYYANSNICMIGLLFATSIFFTCYQGYDWKDKVASCLQAIGALGIIMFPCNTPEAPDTVGLFGLPVAISHIIHCCFASLLFITFATTIMFLFTLGDINNEQKKKRNALYRICGIIMYSFILIQAISSFIPYPAWFPVTLINEWVMLICFGVAWLCKAGVFKKFNDLEEDND